MVQETSDIVQQELRHGVLVLWISNPPVNALGFALRAGLASAFAEAGQNPAVHAIALLARGLTFPVGADISEFGKPRKSPVLYELCNLVEACPKPVVAGLHGSALGGGLELALAAHYRIALAGTRLGLPEVGLGILPGAGGTQRLPRLTGAEAALRMMLSGRPVQAQDALERGLIDRVVTDDLESATVEMAREVAGKPVVPTRDRRDGFSDAAACMAAIAAARKTAKNNPLPGHARIVDCVEAALLLPFDQGQAFENAAFTDLVTSPEAVALRYMFFAERAAAKIEGATAIPNPVTSVTVLGAGADAAGLVLLLLGAGVEVVLADTSKAGLVPGLEMIVTRLDRDVAAGRMSAEEKDARWSLLIPDLAQDLETLGDVLFVTGAFASKNAELPELALGASTPVVTLGWPGVGRRNSLGLEMATEDLTGDRREPAKLVELITSADTAHEAISTVVTLLRRMRRTVVQVRNRAVGSTLIRVMRSALLHVEDQHGVAPVMDLLQRWDMTGAEAPGTRAGHDLFSGVAPVVLGALANAGLRMVSEGRALRPADIDLIFSGVYGFPRWGGGPMHWAAGRGLLVLRQDLLTWSDDSPELFSPAPLLNELIRKGIALPDFSRAPG